VEVVVSHDLLGRAMIQCSRIPCMPQVSSFIFPRLGSGLGLGLAGLGLGLAGSAPSYSLSMPPTQTLDLTLALIVGLFVYFWLRRRLRSPTHPISPPNPNPNLYWKGYEFYIKEWPKLFGKSFKEAIFSFPDAVVCGVFLRTPIEVSLRLRLRLRLSLSLTLSLTLTLITALLGRRRSA